MLQSPKITAPIIGFLKPKIVKYNPIVSVDVGRDETDSYSIVIEPKRETGKYRPLIWDLVSQGSHFSNHLNYVSVCFKSLDDHVWVGVEVIVSHQHRGAYIEAFYSLLRLDDALDCLTELALVPVILTTFPSGQQIGCIDAAPSETTTPLPYFCSPHLRPFLHESIELLRKGTRFRGNTTPFGQQQKRHDKLTLTKLQYIINWIINHIFTGEKNRSS